MTKLQRTLTSVILLVLILTGCSTPAEPPSSAKEADAISPPTETATALPPTDTPVPATATSVAVEPTVTDLPPEPTAIQSPTETPDTIAQAGVDSCVRCHGDKEKLIETAAPLEEKPPSESSGVG